MRLLLLKYNDVPFVSFMTSKLFIYLKQAHLFQHSVWLIPELDLNHTDQPYSF